MVQVPTPKRLKASVECGGLPPCHRTANTRRTPLTSGCLSASRLKYEMFACVDCSFEGNALTVGAAKILARRRRVAACGELALLCNSEESRIRRNDYAGHCVAQAESPSILPKVGDFRLREAGDEGVRAGHTPSSRAAADGETWRKSCPFSIARRVRSAERTLNGGF